MQKRKTVVAAFFVCLFGMVLGCVGGRVVIGDSPPPPAGPPVYEKAPPPWAPAHGHRAKYAYYYYPDAYVYYCTSREQYFYLEGDRWVVTVSLPQRVLVRLGTRVFIEMDSERPYSQFSSHKKKHPPGHMKKKDKWVKKKK